MIHSIYRKCNSIVLVNWIGMSLTQGKEMPRDQFTTFEKRMFALLDRISETKTGRKLFGAIARTNRVVKIHEGDDFQDNAAKMDPNVTTNGPAAAIKPFRPAQYNMPLALKGTENQWIGKDTSVDRSTKFKEIKTQMKGLGLPTKTEQTAPVLAAILNRAHLGMTLDPQITHSRFRQPMRELPVRLNISANDFENMVCGIDYMTDSVYYPLCFLLYDYLLPGDGTNTQIRVMNTKTFENDFKNDIKAEGKVFRSKESTTSRLEACILAHELIHAWRMMAGRKIVASGWEEEAMTTGIGPFSAWQMTENSFRADLGLSTRMIYANPSHSSELMSQVAGQTKATGYRGIMF